MISIGLNLIGFIQSIFLGSILLVNKNGNRHLAIVGSGLLLVFSILILNSLRILVFGPDAFHHYELLSNYSLLLIGPLIYFYARIEIQQYQLKKKDAIHFLPFVLLFTLFLPIRMAFDPYNPLLLGVETLSGAFLIISLIIYLVLALQQAVQSFEKLRKSFLIALFGFSIIWMINLIIQTVGSFSENFHEQWFIFSTLLLSVLVVMLCYQHWIELIQALNPIKSSLKIKKEDRTNFLKNINEEFRINKPYLNPGYSLTDLSRHTSIPSSYVSKVINTEFNMNFQKYIAKLRIEEFVIKAQEDANKNLTLMGLATKVGFKSSSSFNKAFKENMRMLPSEFMKKVKMN